MNHKKTAGSHSPFVFPPNPGFFGAGAQSAPPPPPFAPYLVPAQTPWAGAATMNNVLTPNHPYLQVFYVLFFSYTFSLTNLLKNICGLLQAKKIKKCKFKYPFQNNPIQSHAALQVLEFVLLNLFYL